MIDRYEAVSCLLGKQESPLIFRVAQTAEPVPDFPLGTGVEGGTLLQGARSVLGSIFWYDMIYGPNVISCS